MSARERTLANLKAEYEVILVQRAQAEEERQQQRRAEHKALCLRWWNDHGSTQFTEKFGFTPIEDTLSVEHGFYAVTFETTDGLFFKGIFHPRNPIGAWHVQSKRRSYAGVSTRDTVAYMAYCDNLYIKE